MRLLIATALIALVAQSGFAENENQTTMATPVVGNWQVQDPLGAWPFIGAGIGYADHNDSVRTEGVPTQIKMLGSYYFENRRWVSDLSIGLNNHVLTQNGSDSDNILTADVGLGARYRFARGIQAGPTWNTMIGSDRYNSANDLNTSFVGAEVLKEWALKNEYLLRVGGKVMTDVDVRNEQVNVAMLQVALGFIPQRSGDSLTAIERGERAIVAQTVQGRNAPLAGDVPTMNVAQFALSSTRLNVEANRKLERLSKALKANADIFTSIKVIGHADPSGPEQMNNRLARARAENVAQIFASSGISKDMIQVSSLGAKAPVVDSYDLDDLAKSRRVEIQFVGVKDKAKLEKLLSEAQ